MRLKPNVRPPAATPSVTPFVYYFLRETAGLSGLRVPRFGVAVIDVLDRQAQFVLVVLALAAVFGLRPVLTRKGPDN
jgi:hypothetical protein